MSRKNKETYILLAHIWAHIGRCSFRVRMLSKKMISKVKERFHRFRFEVLCVIVNQCSTTLSSAISNKPTCHYHRQPDDV